MFVFSTTLLCIFVFSFCWVYIVKIKNSEDITIWRALTKSPASIVLIIYCFVCVWFVGGLSVFHFYLMSTNQVNYYLTLGLGLCNYVTQKMPVYLRFSFQFYNIICCRKCPQVLNACLSWFVIIQLCTGAQPSVMNGGQLNPIFFFNFLYLCIIFYII